MVANQIEWPKFEQRSVTRFLETENGKQYKIYKMFDVYGKACFNQKIFPNGLNMGFPQWAWIEKWVNWVKVIDFPIKKMFRAPRSLNKVMLSVFWDMKGTITSDFLEKCATVNSSSNCQILEQNSTYVLNKTRIFWHKLHTEYDIGDISIFLGGKID